MTDSSNSLRLPVDPFLYNSTAYWLDQHPITFSDPEYPEFYKRYQNWMRDQGVVIRDLHAVTVGSTGLDFVDEQSMLMFILRWSN
jgi:hypothetical protein